MAPVARLSSTTMSASVSGSNVPIRSSKERQRALPKVSLKAMSPVSLRASDAVDSANAVHWRRALVSLFVLLLIEHQDLNAS